MFRLSKYSCRYGLEHDLQPDTNLWQDKNTGEWSSHPSVDKEDFRRFMGREVAANIASRGWLETNFYQLGSDIRQHGNSNYMLSYLMQMGGWSMLDYALNYAAQPAPYLRLGYASLPGRWRSSTAARHSRITVPGITLHPDHES